MAVAPNLLYLSLVTMRAARTGLLALGVAACAAPPSDEQTVVDDTVVSLTAEVAQLRVYDRLLHKVDARGIAPELATPEAIKMLRAELAAALTDPACVRVDTDEHSYLGLVFTQCRYTNVYIDGALRLDITSEPGDCGGVQCTVATVYETTATGLTIGRSQIVHATTHLRIPSERDVPREYVASAEIQRETGEAMLGQTELTWLRADGCATAQFGIHLETDDLDISVAGTDVTVCNSRCPRAGSVLLAWDTGATLAWEYAEDGEIRARAPGGRAFTIAPDCTSP